MGMKRAVESIEVKVTPQECFNAATDYGSVVEWQTAAQSVKVIDSDGEGRGKTVEWRVDAKIKRVRYTLEYRYREPDYITWDYIDGDIKELEGSYHFEESPEGTKVTFKLGIDPGFWVPGAVVKMFREQVMGQALRDLKTRLEGR